MATATLESIFTLPGALASVIQGFQPREAQLAMAQAVKTTLDSQGTLVAEAGTGTGKTFAYLIPALLGGHKVFISTGTRNLQDQLFFKDLPLVRKALKSNVRAALLKGRANYLCPHRLELTQLGKRFQTRSEAADLQQILQWAGKSRHGDIAECDTVADSAPIWSKVTSTADNCLGAECEHLSRCFLQQARRQAQEADLVVINHHLFFASTALKSDGISELLPEPDTIIFDEAHQLYETATRLFGESLSGNQMLALVRDTLNEDRAAGGEDRQLPLEAEKLEQQLKAFRETLGREGQRSPWHELAHQAPVIAALEQLQQQLQQLQQQLEPQKERSKGLESCHHRCEQFATQLQRLTGEPQEEHIQWFETFSRSFSLYSSPLQIEQQFQQQMAQWPGCSWIFVSATLAVDNRFDHFCRQLGLDERLTTTHSWPSPFDYRYQALLYVPTAMPEPSHPDYTHAVIDHAVPLIEQSKGGVFLLFTSYRALQQGAKLLQDRVSYPLLVQGESSRSALLEQFREHGNAVLLGTGSFWEGIDVRGEALTAVVIDKLPFASPGDPVLQARIDKMRREGANPFFDYQLPQAVITLKQGVGRLIRDVNDYGVLMLCDPRLTSRSYGATFIQSLPPMTRTRKAEVIERFYRWHREMRHDRESLNSNNHHKNGDKG
ncbi:ATP-dependent DNA helicase [Ectothiorhodospiraceae bacterium BW-2]|nr:ATP-dependent DNA helicase [Ectothiorhodospiraceae bacterium BW-2]